MTVPLGNTPAPSQTPEELKTEGLVYMAKATQRGEPPVIMFYRTIDNDGTPFAPDPKKIDSKTKEPKLVYPVTVDVFFPNGPLAGRVYRRVGFINAGLTGSIRQTAVGSINVGQLNIATGQGNPYAQLNALDEDALAWATKVHTGAGGNVFRQYDPEGEIGSAPAAAPAAAAAPPADRFAGVPLPGQSAPAPAAPPAPPVAGPPPGFPAPPAAAPTNGQPAPVTVPPPAGVPALSGPPPGFPGAAPAASAPVGIPEPPY